MPASVRWSVWSGGAVERELLAVLVLAKRGGNLCPHAPVEMTVGGLRGQTFGSKDGVCERCYIRRTIRSKTLAVCGWQAEPQIDAQPGEKGCNLSGREHLSGERAAPPIDLQESKAKSAGMVVVRWWHEKSRFRPGVAAASSSGGDTGERRLPAKRRGRFLGRASCDRFTLGALGSSGRWTRRAASQTCSGSAAQTDPTPRTHGAGLGGQTAHALRLCQRSVDRRAFGGLDRATLGRGVQRQLPGGLVAGARALAPASRAARLGT